MRTVPPVVTVARDSPPPTRRRDKKVAALLFEFHKGTGGAGGQEGQGWVLLPERNGAQPDGTFLPPGSSRSYGFSFSFFVSLSLALSISPAEGSLFCRPQTPRRMIHRSAISARGRGRDFPSSSLLVRARARVHGLPPRRRRGNRSIASIVSFGADS